MIEWLNDVAVPVTYENGVYHIKAKPYPNRGPYKPRSESKMDIIRCIEMHPGITQKGLKKRVKIGVNNLNPILKELVESGLVIKTPKKSTQKGEGSQYFIA